MKLLVCSVGFTLMIFCAVLLTGCGSTATAVTETTQNPGQTRINITATTNGYTPLRNRDPQNIWEIKANLSNGSNGQIVYLDPSAESPSVFTGTVVIPNGAWVLSLDAVNSDLVMIWQSYQSQVMCNGGELNLAIPLYKIILR